jgi:hypothetical protein
MIFPFSFEALTSPITVTEARAAIYNVLARLKVNTTNWAPGDPTRTMAAAASVMFAALSEAQRDFAAAGFLELATGSMLRMNAYFVYGERAQDATFASGNVVLTNGGGGLYEVEAGDLVVRNVATGKTYRNMGAFTLASGIGQTVTVAVIATESGTSSNADATAIAELVTTLPRVTVTNPTALIARDAESPAELRARCREKLGSISPFGPWDAYSYAARTAKLSTGEPAGVTRTMVRRDGFGNLYVTVATASGGVAGTVGDTATAIGAIDDAIARSAEPLGITAHVESATPLPVTVAYEAFVYPSSLTTAEIRARVSKALGEFFATHPIGGARLVFEATVGYVFTEAIASTIRGALPMGTVFHVVLSAPVADVELGLGEVPVLVHVPETHATITVVQPPEGLLT